MALIKCPECGWFPVSDTPETKCSCCGCNVAHVLRMNRAKEEKMRKEQGLCPICGNSEFFYKDNVSDEPNLDGTATRWKRVTIKYKICATFGCPYGEEDSKTTENVGFKFTSETFNNKPWNRPSDDRWCNMRCINQKGR